MGHLYAIEYKRDLDLLDISWSGLFSPDGVAQYANDCRICWQRERFRDGFLLRILMSDGQPLTQDALQTMKSVFADFPKPRRIAMITRGAISRLQLKRALMLPNMQIFDNSDLALAWLLERNPDRGESPDIRHCEPKASPAYPLEDTA